MSGTAYPATLLTAGENDSRVHPLHARKMTAALQAATSADPSEDPILLWVDRETGHGVGKPLATRIREAVDELVVHGVAARLADSLAAQHVYNEILQSRESGGIGRRAGLRIQWGNPWEFESPLSHQWNITKE